MLLIVKQSLKMSHLQSNRLYQYKSDCNGCGTCVFLCHQKSIVMKEDEEGFLYPHINVDQCIDCFLCEEKCPHKNPIVLSKRTPKAFGLKLNDQGILAKSSSGGAFSALYSAFFDLHPNGIVYGCVLSINANHVFVAKHIRATSPDECEQFRGSKYLQSVFWPIFDSLEADLKKGYYVLCVGTPCQMAGVYRCFSHRYKEQLVLVEIICHSVPSPLMFNEHFST